MGGHEVKNFDFVIIDGSSMLVRAYFATVYPGRPIKSVDGVYTNAVMGFLNMMFTALSQFKPSHVFVAWDMSRDTFRRELYPAYKGTRGELPDELLMQFTVMQEVLSALGVSQALHPNYEADDLIGTFAMAGMADNLQVLVLTGDRDALQLVRPGVTVAIMKKGVAEMDQFTPDSLLDKYGVTATQMIDVKSLMGDTSDNIPGVPGIGEKTALKLIRDYHSLEGVYVHLDEIKGKLHDRLAEHQELAMLSKKLAAIVLDVPIAITVSDCRLSFDTTSGMQKLQSLKLNNSAQWLAQYA